MNNLNLDKYLNIVNEQKDKRGLNEYIPLYPMLRVENDKLYIGVMLTHEKDNVWSMTEDIKPEYWVLIDVNTEKIISFNKTDEKDFVIGEVIPKNRSSKNKEISKYSIEKTLQYKNYLINDIKEFELPIQKKLSDMLGKEFELDGEKVNINDYIFANLEEDVKKKIDDLVQLLVWSKYSSITFYYDIIFNNVIDEYLNNNTIDNDKIKLCIEIMNNYYDGVTYIDNFFNVN